MENWLPDPKPLLDWITGRPGTVVMFIASVLAILAYMAGWWQRLGQWLRRLRHRSQPSRAVVQADQDMSKAIAKRLLHILEPLAAQLEGLGSVLRRFGPPADRETRYQTMDELLGDYDRLKDRLYDIGDDKLVEALRNEFRTVRHKTLPLAKRHIESQHVHEESGEHLGDEAFWSTIFKAQAGSLEWHGRFMKRLAQMVQEIAQPNEAPVGTWTAKHLKQIADQYWHDKTAYCPVDSAELKLVRDHTAAKARILMATCPRCGRNASTF